jgi:nitrate reductase NapE component
VYLFICLVVSGPLVSTSDEIVYTTLNYVLNTMNTDTTVQTITSGIQVHSPANICYKTRPHSPKKFKQGNTGPLTTKQINRYTHALCILFHQKLTQVRPMWDVRVRTKARNSLWSLWLFFAHYIYLVPILSLIGGHIIIIWCLLMLRIYTR